MPEFFSKSNLTDTQKANWNAAIVEYEHVLESNFERRFAVMTREDRDFFCKQYSATTDEEIKTKMRSFVNLTANPPGHSKSALFARLLDGKPPLPFPPPTSFSYPWYTIIEDNGPHSVRLGGAPTLASLINGASGASGEFSLFINQCDWSVLDANAAARSLLDLQPQLAALASRDEDGTIGFFVWTDDLLQRVKDSYAAKPEFTVQHGPWPAYRLFVGQIDDACHQGFRYCAADSTIDNLRGAGSVFDLDLLKLNSRVGKTISKGVHPKARLDQARLRASTIRDNSFIEMLDQKDINRQLAELEKNVLDYEANPDSFDWVELFCDRWCLQKV